jgi:hypothetical protein
VGFNFAPLEKDTPADFVIRENSLLQPVIYGALGFLESLGNLGFADENLRGHRRYARLRRKLFP